MVGTDVAIIYSPAEPADRIREALAKEQVESLAYWTGIAVCVSLCLSLCALLCNFTARTTFNCLSKENAPIILRSSIGIYASLLPLRLLQLSMYCFFLVCFLSFWLIMDPTAVGITISLGCAAFLALVLLTLWNISRLIISNGALGEESIMPQDREETYSSSQLSDFLLKQTALAKKARIPVNYQYRVPYHEILKNVQRGRVEPPLQKEVLDDLKIAKKHTVRKQAWKSTSLHKGDFPPIDPVQIQDNELAVEEPWRA
jgi:hypothetical protein